MSLAFTVYTSSWKAAMLDFAKMAIPLGYFDLRLLKQNLDWLRPYLPLFWCIIHDSSPFSF